MVHIKSTMAMNLFMNVIIKNSRALLLGRIFFGDFGATLHNLHFYLHLMQQARDHIESGDFEDWSDKIIPQLQQEAE